MEGGKEGKKEGGKKEGGKEERQRDYNHAK